MADGLQNGAGLPRRRTALPESAPGISRIVEPVIRTADKRGPEPERDRRRAGPKPIAFESGDRHLRRS